MKQSQFLVTSPVEDGVLLFNTLNSALVHLSKGCPAYQRM